VRENYKVLRGDLSYSGILRSVESNSEPTFRDKPVGSIFKSQELNTKLLILQFSYVYASLFHLFQFQIFFYYRKFLAITTF
jgi:hypothetical protein